MAWWARRGVAGCTRRPRRAFFADSTTSPNRPAPPRECSFGRSPPTRRPCAILVGPSPCLSRMAPPPTTRLSLRVRSVVFTPQRWSSVFFLTLLVANTPRDGASPIWQARVALGVRSERGREERLPVSARRVHDAARERRIPWSVNLTSSSGCPVPRRSTGHSLLHPLGALSLLDGPTSTTGQSTANPHRLHGARRRVALGQV